MSDGVNCIDGYMSKFQMTMVADALGDCSEPQQRMALQYVAQMCGSVSTLGRVEGLLAGGLIERADTLLSFSHEGQRNSPIAASRRLVSGCNSGKSSSIQAREQAWSRHCSRQAKR